MIDLVQYSDDGLSWTDWDRACLLSGRYCEPYVTVEGPEKPERKATDTRLDPETGEDIPTDAIGDVPRKKHVDCYCGYGSGCHVCGST